MYRFHQFPGCTRTPNAVVSFVSQLRWSSSTSRRDVSDSPFLPEKKNRILFLGGDEVSVAALRRIHQRLESQASALNQWLSSSHNKEHHAHQEPLQGRKKVAASDFIDVVCPTVHLPAAALSGSSASTSSSGRKKERNSKVKGATNPVYDYCQEHQLRVTPVPHARSLVKPCPSSGQVFQLPKAPATFADRPDAHDYGVVCVVSFRYFLGPKFLRSVPSRVINLHPSLLPKYRGASPISETLVRGDTEGGVSIIKIVPGEPMDCGDVLLQAKVPSPPSFHSDVGIPLSETISTYFPRVVEFGAKQMEATIFGADAKAVPLDCGARPPLGTNMRNLDALWDQAWVQPDKFKYPGASFMEDPFHAPLRSKKDTLVDWAPRVPLLSPYTLANKHRAFERDFPLHCMYDPSKTPIATQIKKKEKLVKRGVMLLEVVHPDLVAEGDLSAVMAAAVAANSPSAAISPGSYVWCGNDCAAAFCGVGSSNTVVEHSASTIRSTWLFFKKVRVSGGNGNVTGVQSWSQGTMIPKKVVVNGLFC